MPATSVADKSVRLLQLSLVVADDFMVVARCAADVATVDRTRFAALHSQMIERNSSLNFAGPSSLCIASNTL